MKKKTGVKVVLFLASFLMWATFGMMAKDKEEGVAKVKFEEKFYDFGIVPEEGGRISHDFVFTNEGTSNLVILEAKAECGCTSATFTETPVAPGQKGVVKVTYNPMGRPGAFTKSVTVRTNGDPQKVYLKIRGNVTPRTNK